MVVDYNTLRTWNTPDLMLRDSMLMGRTRVMGMSQTAAIVHVVSFVCTSGTSLPINLAFFLWHRYRYVKVREERKWIRQILGTRNVAYKGRGHWVNANPNPSPNAAHHWNATPVGFGAPCAYNTAPGDQWVYNDPSAGHWVQGTPPAGRWVYAAPSGGHWVQSTPGMAQTVFVTPTTPHTDNGPQTQLALDVANNGVNNLQQDFDGNDNDAENQDPGAFVDQSYYNC